MTIMQPTYPVFMTPPLVFAKAEHESRSPVDLHR